MPELAGRKVEAGHFCLAAKPAQHAAVGQLPAAARIEGGLSERHLARQRRRYRGLYRQRFGMFVAEEMHAAELIARCAAVLAKIADLRRSRRRGRTASA